MTVSAVTATGDASPVLLVRHAATAWSGVRYCGRSDPWLSPDGRAAADRLAAALARELAGAARPIVVISSPRRRCRQTARAIVAAIAVSGLPLVRIDERWAEVDFGRWEGRTWAQVEAADPALAARLLAADPAIDWPGGEAASTFRARVDAAWQDACSIPGPVIVVTHGGPIRHVLAASARTDTGRADAAWPDVGSVHRVLRSAA